MLPSSAIGHRSVESIHSNTNSHYFEDVTVYLKYASAPLFTYAWTSSEIANRKNLITAGGIPSLVFVAVNGEAIANGSFANTTELTAAYNTITIASQNAPITIGTNDSNGNLAGTYGTSQTAMVYGETSTTIPHPTLGDTRQASVELASAVARFELGTLKAADPAEITSLTVDAIYVNNYYTTLNQDIIVDIDGSTWEDDKPADGHWSKTTGDDALVTSNSGTMCYAFQTFPTLVPHFIYEISGTLASGVRLPDGTTGSFYGKYITIIGFAEFTNIVRHTIYKMGLTDGGIPIGINNITVLPEVEVNALEVVITIAPWTDEALTPEIF